MKKLLIVIFVVQGALCSENARSQDPYIFLGPQQGLADQPYVDIEVFDELGNSLGPDGGDGGLFGYNIYAHLLLDTGANGILVVDAAAQSLEDNGLVTEAEFLEMGVAGYTVYEVSAPYQLNFWGADEAVRTLPLAEDSVRMQVSSVGQLGGPIDWGGIPGLIGMPAMTGRVTSLDFSHWSGMSDLFDFNPMNVSFPETTSSPGGSVPYLPDGDGHRYTVPLFKAMTFDPEDGRPEWEEPDSALPTYGDVPFFTAKARTENDSEEWVEKTGTFLLDTGAQLSMISRNTAFALGLDADGDGDLEDDALDFVDIGGVGGTTRVPIHVVDEFHIPTAEGVELVWGSDDPEYLGIEFIVLDLFDNADVTGDGVVNSDDLDVVRAHWGEVVFPGDITRGDCAFEGESAGVIDSEDLNLIRSQWGQDTFLDGIFGVDLLAAGVDMYAILNGQSGGDPFFQQVHFDFLDWDNENGSMVLDLSSSYDVVVNPPASVPEPGLTVLLVGGLLLFSRRMRCRCNS